jgi:hypothetical protein
MWNKQYKIYGYHIHEAGKPVEINRIIDKQRRCVEIQTVIPFRGGRLLGSVALARDPREPDKFFRAVALVHQKDLGTATKRRGREITVGRMMMALKDNDVSRVDILSFDQLEPSEQRIFRNR